MMEMKIEDLIKKMKEKGATDLHLKVGSRPVLRVKRDLLVLSDCPPFGPADTQGLAGQIMNDYQKAEFGRRKELDFAYVASNNLGRFRVNAFRQKGNVSLVLRLIKDVIPSFEELNLPPILKDIAMSQRGIILVTGTTSCGKSTTLASMMDYVNSNKRCHIVTVEDPIEYLHADKKSIVSQREIGLDTDSFGRALKHVVRQDPDIILIGEMRDAETFSAALAASETGHLVFSTLHSADVMQAFDRILEFFPSSQHQQIKMQLAINLKSVICQRLMPNAAGTGLIPAVEIMVNTPTVAQLIREDRISKILPAMQSGGEDGMQTFNQSLVELLKKKLISLEEALAKSSNPEALKMNLKGIYLDEDRKILGGK